jgi:phosphoglycerate dehydrogenase-like enzyme
VSVSPRILYLSHASKEVYALIAEQVPSNFTLVTLDTDSDDERYARIADCEVVIIAGTGLRGPLIKAAKQLRLAHHQGVGYEDTVDWELLKARGIPLALTPEGTTIGVAEHTVLLTLALCKRLTFADSELRQGRWHVNALRPVSIELHGRTIGYVGMGRIGQAAAERFKAFGTKGIYFDPQVALEPERERELGLRRAAFPTLLAESDVVTLHVPLTPRTKHIIDMPELKRMKPSAILINTARGGLINEMALCDALLGGTIAGASLDVFESEPLATTSPLVGLSNVILTPHIAAGTRDAMKTKMRAIFANIGRFYRGEPLLNRVDFKSEQN